MSKNEPVDNPAINVGDDPAMDVVDNTSRELIDTLLSIKQDKYEVWKYFGERADHLGERLWATGTWLMSIIAATLSLPFVAKFIYFENNKFHISHPISIALIAIFGIAFCLYSKAALYDLREHIESNWRRSTYALTGKMKKTTWGGRKGSGWSILFGVGTFSVFAFIMLLLIAIASFIWELK